MGLKGQPEVQLSAVMAIYVTAHTPFLPKCVSASKRNIIRPGSRVRGVLGPESLWNRLCTPGMGVDLWGASPLCVNPVSVVRR
jgi:hypothetical protein